LAAPWNTRSNRERVEKISWTDRNRVAFFFRVARKGAVKKRCVGFEKIFNSPFQISLQEKKIQKKIFALAIQLDRFIEWC